MDYHGLPLQTSDRGLATRYFRQFTRRRNTNSNNFYELPENNHEGDSDSFGKIKKAEMNCVISAL